MADKTWANGSAGVLSTGTWSPVGKPVAGDNLIFNNTSDFGCTLDEAVTYGTIAINSGYDGAVTLGANVGCSSCTVAAGTLTGSTSYTLTVSAGFTWSAGSLTTNVLKIIMSTDGGTMALLNDTPNLHTVTINGNVTWTLPSGFDNWTRNLTVAVDKTLTVNKTTNVHNLVFDGVASSVFDNNGTIAGTARLRLAITGALGANLDLGDVDVDTQMDLTTGAAADRTLTLAGNASVAGYLLIASSHATYTLTLAHGTNYTLDVTGLTTLSTRALMTQGTGTWTFTGGLTQSGASSVFTQGGAITCTGDLTVSAGTFTPLSTANITCAGSITHNTGTWTADRSNITMTGSGETVSGIIDGRSWTFSDDTSLDAGAQIHSAAGGTFEIAAAKTLSMGVASLIYIEYDNAGFTNGGVIDTGGSIYFQLLNADKTLSFGTINCDATVYALATSTANRKCTLGANSTLGGTLTLQAAHASYTFTFDCDDKNLTCGDIALANVRTILLGGSGTLTCDDLDFSNGTWTPETSDVTVAGSITTSATQTFYDLSVAAGGAASLVNDITVTNDLTITGGTMDFNDMDVDVVNVTVGAGGTLSMGNGDTTVTGDWDSSAGTIVQEGSTIYFEGTTTLTVAAADSFHYFIIPYGGAVTLGSDVWVDNLPLLYGTLTEGLFELLYGGETREFPIATATSDVSCSVPASHHGTHFAQNRYWDHYFNGTTIYIRATDGTTLLTPQAVLTPLAYTYIPLDNFDLCFDGNTVHCVYAPEAQLILYYRQGALNADGTVTWASDWVVASSWLVAANRVLALPRIHVASDGVIFLISAGMNLESYPGGTWTFCITLGSFAAGVFTVDATYADAGRESYAPAPTKEYQPSPGACALAAGEMYFIYINENPLTVTEASPSLSLGVHYDPTTGYGAAETVASYPSGTSYDMVYDATLDDIHVVFNRFRYRFPTGSEVATWYNVIITGSDLTYVKKPSGAGWDDPTILDSEDAFFEPYMSPAICLDEDSGDIYVLYNSTNDQMFYYRKYNVATTSWGAQTLFIQVANLPNNAYLYQVDMPYLTCAPEVVHNEIITQFQVSEHDHSDRMPDNFTRVAFYLHTIPTMTQSHAYRTHREPVRNSKRLSYFIEQ